MLKECRGVVNLGDSLDNYIEAVSRFSEGLDSYSDK